MKKVLFVRCSPRGDSSLSIKLADEVIRKLEHYHGGLDVTTMDLSETPPAYLTDEQISSFFTPPEHQTGDQKRCLAESDHYIDQLKSIDIAVICYPVWNYMIPACLKAWIDQIVRPGQTFKYNDGVPEGLLTDKKTYLIPARGGIYPDQFNDDAGPFFDFSVQYMKTVLSYIGITDISVAKVEGTAIPEFQDDALDKGFRSIAVP